MLARSPALIVAREETAADLAAECGGTITWRCVGEQAGSLRVGLATPERGDGIVTLAEAVGSFFGTTDYAANDFAEPGFSAWFDDLTELSAQDSIGRRSPLAAALAQAGLFDVVGALEAQAARLLRGRDGFAAIYPEPMSIAEVTLVPRDGIDAIRRARSSRIRHDRRVAGSRGVAHRRQRPRRAARRRRRAGVAPGRSEPARSGRAPAAPGAVVSTARTVGRRSGARIAITLVLAGALLAAACSDGSESPEGAEGDDQRREDCITVDTAVSSEKIELLTELAATFNDSDEAVVDGECVFVDVRSKSSGAATTALADGWDEEVDGPRPVIWSPASSSWGQILNQRLADAGEAPIAPEDPTPFMLTPLVIAMPEPMAEALGWPDTPIGWRQILDLANSEAGWGDFGHPEWGQFRLGKTNPNFSTSGCPR